MGAAQEGKILPWQCEKEGEVGAGGPGGPLQKQL